MMRVCEPNAPSPVLGHQGPLPLRHSISMRPRPTPFRLSGPVFSLRRISVGRWCALAAKTRALRGALNAAQGPGPQAEARACQ